MTPEHFVHKFSRGLLSLAVRRNNQASYLNRLEEIARYEEAGAPLAGLDADGPIVSLTSYGARLETVHLAIASMMDQEVKPRAVILYLDDESSPETLPESLVGLCEKGLIIRRGVENLRGHKKYFFAMRDFPQTSIITIDDDIIYPRDAVSGLLRDSEAHPGCVIARRTHRVTFGADGSVAPYVDWLMEYRGCRRLSKRNFLTGCGGTLFPPQPVPYVPLDADAIRNCALSADDVWLNFSLLSNGVGLYRAHCPARLYWLIEGSQETGLFKTNVLAGGNDEAIARTMEFMGLAASDFLD